MIHKSSLLKSHGSLYLEFVPKDGLFHKMLLLWLMGFLTGWCIFIKVVQCAEDAYMYVQPLTEFIMRRTFPKPCYFHFLNYQKTSFNYFFPF